MSKITTNKTIIRQKIESLERQSQIIRDELEDELQITKEKVINYGKIALGIGGGLIFSAIVLKALNGNRSIKSDSYVKHRSKRVYQRFIDQMVGELSGQAIGFLLGVAKDKFGSHIEKNENADDNDSDITG